jgi:hypothetical protein
LIAAGHPPATVMDYTPRQVGAFIVIAADRRRRELAEQLQINSLASQGEGKAIAGALKELSDGR